MDYLKNFKREINKPIFLIGMPRSGTTLISEILSVHENLGWFSNHYSKLPFVPEVSYLSRILDIPKIGCSLRGKKKQDSRLSSYLRNLLPYCAEAYPIWSRCCGNQFLWDFMIDQCATTKEKQKIRSSIEKVLRLQKKDRFFSKLTGPSRIHYLNSIFPDAYFIHVIRDPRATVSSLMQVSFWKEQGGHKSPWWENGFSQDLIKKWNDGGRSPIVLAGLQWKRIVDLTWQESKLIEQNRYIELHYEDFVNRPYHVLKDILNKVSLPASPDLRRHIESIGIIKNMNYKYKHNLKDSDIDLIEEVTAQTARKAGYKF